MDKQCTCQVFDREKAEIDTVKCFECGSYLSTEELKRFDKDGLLIVN